MASFAEEEFGFTTEARSHGEEKKETATGVRGWKVLQLPAFGLKLITDC
jgi:hypothetical protein